jgi:F-type H+-transporting ATPase subunit a
VQLSPDEITVWDLGPVTLNATVVFSWLVMIILVGGSWLVTRNLSSGPHISRWQNLLETVVVLIRSQIRDITQQDPGQYVAFIGTLFLFISVSNLLSVVPGYSAPAGSLSTTAALAICVFVAVPLFGIRERGVFGYLRNYIEPTPLMLPFNIISEVSRTMALAVRLFGNVMSGRILVAILLAIIPLLVPVIMNLLGLIIGQIQAYIFAVLATVYIASATTKS